MSTAFSFRAWLVLRVPILLFFTNNATYLRHCAFCCRVRSLGRTTLLCRLFSHLCTVRRRALQAVRIRIACAHLATFWTSCARFGADVVATLRYHLRARASCCAATRWFARAARARPAWQRLRARGTTSRETSSLAALSLSLPFYLPADTTAPTQHLLLRACAAHARAHACRKSINALRHRAHLRAPRCPHTLHYTPTTYHAPRGYTIPRCHAHALRRRRAAQTPLRAAPLSDLPSPLLCRRAFWFARARRARHARTAGLDTCCAHLVRTVVWYSCLRALVLDIRSMWTSANFSLSPPLGP